jgi:pyruvate kinase
MDERGNGRSKIVATVGPASREPAQLQGLIAAGADVLRLNFSHGTHDSHRAVIENGRTVARQMDRPLAILQDLCGPKIRVGDLARGEAVELVDGARLAITSDATVVGDSVRISTTYAALARDVRPGDRILLDDGNIELRVLGAASSEVECQVVHGGWLKPRKGMNLPGVALSTPALTDKDRADLAFGVREGVDYIALSFVRQAQDVLDARAAITALGADVPIIAKVEKPEAIDNLQAILDVADGVMVARGDLGVELPAEEVPTLQKRIIALANGAGKVVITATQMLESMIENPRPTRAEASDVANAILDGTDAVMLSAETATGRFPVEAVATMARIARYTEEQHGLSRASAAAGVGTPAARALARVAHLVAEELGCRRIVVFTESGVTAQLVSAFRSRVPITAITPRQVTLRRLALWWGVEPLLTDEADTTDAMIHRGEQILRERDLVQSGDTLLMLAGQSRATGATNMLRVHVVR